MIAIAAEQDRFSIVTIFDADRPAPAWETMFGWPAAARDAVPLAVRSAGDRKIWAARLDQAVRDADRAVLLVADGVGCAASAWWARLSPAHDVARIAGALFFAPEPVPAGTKPSLFASPAINLPFPSLVIQPSHAPAAIGSAIGGWGSRIVVSERPRHARSGAPAWRHAQRLFLRLTTHVAAHEIDRGEALLGLR